MTLLIVAALGLALGLGLLVWGVRERGLRAKAEVALSDCRSLSGGIIAQAQQAAKAASDAISANKRLTAAIAQQRTLIAAMQERLAKTGDPEAIKAWVDAELGETEV